MHIHAHTALPGRLTAGNALSDEATRMLFFFNRYLSGTGSHAIHHQNSNSLRLQFGISGEAARHIIKTCPTSLQIFVLPTYEVNPWVCSPMICSKWMLHIFLILEN